MNWARLCMAAGAAVALTGCGKDGNGPERQTVGSLERVSAATQTARPGEAVTAPPAVRVRDTRGSSMGGVRVVFRVTRGGGTITPAGPTAAPSTVTIEANTEGVARLTGWTLGSVGANQIEATVEGNQSVTAVTFEATGADPCELANFVPHTLGQTINVGLGTFDCRYDSGEFVDFYTVVTTSQQSVRISQNSTAFDTFLLLYEAASGSILALNDDLGPDITNSSIHMLLPAGSYAIGASSLEPNVTGAYTLVSQSVPEKVAACDDLWVMRGVTTAQSLATSDCRSTNGFYHNWFPIVVRANETITITMNSTAVDGRLDLVAADGVTIVRQDDNGGGGTNARIQYTSPNTTLYYIRPTTAVAGQTGGYTLSVQ